MRKHFNPKMQLKCSDLLVRGTDSNPVGSGYGSFNHQAKIVRKTLISTVLWLLYDFLSLKNVVNVLQKWYGNQKAQKKIIFCRRLEGHWRKEQDTDLLVRGIDLNPDPDSYQNVMEVHQNTAPNKRLVLLGTVLYFPRLLLISTATQKVSSTGTNKYGKLSPNM
jgi:hypothetical protein